MKTKLLYSICLYLVIQASMTVSAIDVHKIVPIASDINLKIEISLSAFGGDKCKINTVIVHSKDKSKLCSVSKDFSFTHKADTTIVLNIDNLLPKLWSPVDPNLYDLTIDIAGNTYNNRIGFRKFEMRSGAFYLNDKPIYLRGNAINPPERGIPEDLEKSKEFARDYVRFMKSLNINIIRIPDNQNWMDVCDEEGMMIFAGRYGRPKHGTADAPPADFELSMKTYKEIDLGPFTPHPSVVVYVLSNEMPYEGERGDLYRDFLSKMHRELKKWDDTRLYIGNAGYGLGKSADIYDVHRYWGWYYNTFLTYLNMRDMNMWQNPGKMQPITFTECVGNYTGMDGRFNLCSRTKQPGSQKCWTGHIADDEQAETAMSYQAFVLKNATEMFRRLRSQNNRLAGIMPFTIMFHNWDGVKSFADMKPKPVAQQYQISYQPVLLSWENWQSQVYAGNSLSVTAHVVNDADNGEALTDARLVWWIEKAGAKVALEECKLPVIPYYGTYKQSLSLNIPQSLSTGEYLLKGEIWSGQTKISHNEDELFIANKGWSNSKHVNKTIYVYDSSVSKQTLKGLQKLGYSAELISSIKKLPKTSTLVIGKDAWDNTLNDQKDILKQYVDNGGRVICLKQNPDKFNQEWLPVSVEFLKNSNNNPEYISPTLAYVDGMNINMERPYHPVFEGLGHRNFRLWTDYTQFDESRSGFPAIYPVTQGYDLRNSKLENVAILANYSRALSATALCEMFSGKGSVLLSGFDLINRCGIDPVADRFLSNMIQYMSSDNNHKVYVEVKDSIVWGDYASERGIVNGTCNGLMLNTVPIIPKGQEHESKYQIKTDEYGYQYAGSYGGWNSKPGVQYVPYGRRPMAPFSFSRGGSPLISKKSTVGEGYFYVTIPQNKKTMVTVLENPDNVSIRISIAVNDETPVECVIEAKQRLSVKTDISKTGRNMKVALRGDRRTILIKTIFE